MAGGDWEAGIDEAGRGPVLGPLVVAAVATQEPARLAAMGCRDSKRLTPAARERLARLIQADAGVRVAVGVMPPEQIDALRQTRSLNDIEVDMFARVAKAVDAQRVVADAADVDAARFAARLADQLPPSCDVRAEHGADDCYPTVAAASILAKVTRDREVLELARRLERRLGRPVGSGYPGDSVTAAFLDAWVDRFGDVPEGTRRSWVTAKRLLAPRQATLPGHDAPQG